jgi:hypothetical protein
MSLVSSALWHFSIDTVNLLSRLNYELKPKKKGRAISDPAFAVEMQNLSS